MRDCFPKPKSLELHLSKYATKAGLKNAKGVNMPDFAVLAHLKSDVDK